jgi:two-component system OmpR family sensor kinase
VPEASDEVSRLGETLNEMRARAGFAELHVVDEGMGFPDGFTGRAFDRFSSADGEGDGSGLGLAIVETIADAHGGHTGAGNRRDGGADVWFSVPLP